MSVPNLNPFEKLQKIMKNLKLRIIERKTKKLESRLVRGLLSRGID